TKWVQRGNGWAAKICIAFLKQWPEPCFSPACTHKRQHDGCRQIHITKRLHRLKLCGRELRQLLWHKQATIAGKACKHGVIKRKGHGLAAGGSVEHRPPIPSLAPMRYKKYPGK